MARARVHKRRRAFRILRLFFSLVLDFLFQYARARLSGRTYDFFEDSKRNRARAIRIRKEALQLGGLLIKVGQFLSSRVDLLPTEYIEELALLQDEVPAVPFDRIRPIVESELGGSISSLFAFLDPEPVAAASLGQVHRAGLLTGEVVALKVQRPDIDEIIEADLAALRYIVGWLNRYTVIGRRADLPLILREFEDTLRLELNFLAEGHHAERLACLFAGSERIIIPRVYWSYTARRVLSMQFMEGIKVTDFERLDRAGISRELVAESLLQAYLQQVVEDGFFHADPHPGNILIRPGPQIVLLDFGMVGEIAPKVRDNLKSIFLAVIRRDYDEIIEALARLGFLAPSSDRALLRRAIVWTIETFYDLSFAELQAINPAEVFDQLQDVIYSESVRIPANFAFLGRAVGTLSGLCTALDPSFQFVTVAEPFARRLITPRGRVVAVLEQVGGEARSLASTAYALPFLTRGTLEATQQLEVEVRDELDRVVRGVDRLERATRRVVSGLLGAAFLLAGASVLNKHHVLLSAVAFAIAFILILSVVWPARRATRRF
jgi:predicted unusual protein kinase regulating ubiquinone biosynthesis (AarF/ABC1/UbiB family)